MASKNSPHTVSDKHLVEIARHLTEWEELAPYLDVDEAAVVEIRKDNTGAYRQQKIAFLRRWKEICGDRATYHALKKAAETIGMKNLATFVADIQGAFPLHHTLFGSLKLHSLIPQVLICPTYPAQPTCLAQPSYPAQPKSKAYSLS